MKYSYSRVSCFAHCPYQFKLKYIDEIGTVPNQEADNALIIGNAMHMGIEKTYEVAANWYLNNFYILTDKHINELIKLEILIDKAKRFTKEDAIFEYEIVTDNFHGFVDMIIKNSDGTVNIYDFKYTKNIDRYMESWQLHIYRYYLEKYCDMKVKAMGYVFIPKTLIRQKNTENLYQFRKRLKNTLENMQVKIIKLAYDESKFGNFINSIKEIENTKIFNKNHTKLCDWCDYKTLCWEELDYMNILPKNEKRTPKINTKPDMWLYGDSYAGKTVFVDGFKDVLMINTDGNTDHITSPVLRITDTIETVGRITKRKFAWESFVEIIQELEKKENDYKTIVLDLVEDLYEHCRLYIYNKYNVEHEQDLGFGKGWDLVRTEFLSKIKRLKNVGYQIIYISKVTVSEITKKNGDKITVIKPNINDKVANVLAGTVDLTARVVADDDERYLSFKTSPYIFGGSRYNFGTDKINLNEDEFIKILTKSQGGN